MKKKYRIDKVLKWNLNEQDSIIPEEDNNEDTTKNSEKSKQEKEKEIDHKDIGDVNKDDLEDNDSETIEDEEIAVSITMNADASNGGQIKLVPFKKLSSLVSIESVLKLFNIDPDNVESDFKEKMEVTIKSPLSDYKNEEYVIRLMDKIGEISIRRENFSQTLTKKSTNTNLQQAVTQQIGEPLEQSKSSEKNTEKTIDLSYLPGLNYDFKKSIKSEFFDRILVSNNE